MPRSKKPEAKPEQVPRTEKDLDKLVTAIEKHKGEGDRLGRALLAAELEPMQVLEQAELADAKLYDLCDEIMIERTEEFSERDNQEKLRSGRAKSGH